MNVSKMDNSLGLIPTELIPDITKVFQNFLSGKLRERFNSKTLDEFNIEYLSYVRNNHSDKYYLSSKLSMKHLIKFLGPEIRLIDITAHKADLFLSDIKRKAPKGYLVYYRTLKSAFSKAKVWGYVDVNPFTEVHPGKVQRSKPTVINNDNLKIILAMIKNKTVQLIVQSSYYTGCRLSEVLNLKIRNVNLKEKLIRIGDETFNTKSRRERTVPIPDRLFDLLKKHLKNRKKDTGYLFIKPNGFPYSADYISKYFKKAVRKSKLNEDIHFHSLRHSYASNLAASGASPYCLRDLLGHSSISVTEIYTHTQLDDLRNTVNLLNIHKR
jgi:site-specific recombinase XerD